MQVRISKLRAFLPLFALAVAASACATPPRTVPPPTETPAAAPSPTRTAPAAPTPTAAPARSPTPTVNIVVTSPAPGTTIGNPVRISGVARVFEAALIVALKDGRGNVLGTMPVMASEGAPGWGDFSADLAWNAGAATTPDGRIEAYAHSARDGSIIDLFTVNVTLPARPPAAAASPTPTPARTPAPSPTRGP